MRPTHLVPGAIGMLIAVVLNIRGWWLNDGSRVRNVLIVLAIAALIVGFVGDPKRTIRREIALWVGFVVGMTAVLFAIGPGTIFPIVIAIGASLAALAILMGSVPAMFRAR
jgi:hypothetical protein